MKVSEQGSGLVRWSWALLIGVAFHVALYWGVALTRSDSPALKQRLRQFTEIQYIDSAMTERSELLIQEMTLFDPRPLLLPTEWNASSASNLSTAWSGENLVFPEFDPMFELEDGNYIDDFGNVPANYDQLSTAQSSFEFGLLRQLGTRARSPEFRAEPGVSVRARDPGTGALLGEALLYNAAVRDLAQRWPELRPAEFLATVAEGFRSGELMVVSSSGFAEADQSLLRLLRAEFPSLALHEDGVYLLEITP